MKTTAMPINNKAYGIIMLNAAIVIANISFAVSLKSSDTTGLVKSPVISVFEVSSSADSVASAASVFSSSSFSLSSFCSDGRLYAPALLLHGDFEKTLYFSFQDR
jgi:hypothetical protein